MRALESKVALVTGAARGIGEATARCLAREGARVLCLDRPADEVRLWLAIPTRTRAFARRSKRSIAP